MTAEDEGVRETGGVARVQEGALPGPGIRLYTHPGYTLPTVTVLSGNVTMCSTVVQEKGGHSGQSYPPWEKGDHSGQSYPPWEEEEYSGQGSLSQG